MGRIAMLPLCPRGSQEKVTKREVAKEPLPLQSRRMMSRWENKGKTRSSPPLPSPQIEHGILPLQLHCATT